MPKLSGTLSGLTIGSVVCGSLLLAAPAGAATSQTETFTATPLLGLLGMVANGGTFSQPALTATVGDTIVFANSDASSPVTISSVSGGWPAQPITVAPKGSVAVVVSSTAGTVTFRGAEAALINTWPTATLTVKPAPAQQTAAAPAPAANPPAAGGGTAGTTTGAAAPGGSAPGSPAGAPQRPAAGAATVGAANGPLYSGPQVLANLGSLSLPRSAAPGEIPLAGDAAAPLIAALAPEALANLAAGGPAGGAVAPDPLVALGQSSSGSATNAADALQRRRNTAAAVGGVLVLGVIGGIARVLLAEPGGRDGGRRRRRTTSLAAA
ncbi:MAG: hypothetical protein JWM48_1697 [Mycobacterium sp.]|nr:hypothetical protein [Mycobacterium sp.]